MKRSAFASLAIAVRFFERNERIVLARVNHFSAGQLLLDQAAEPQRHVEAQIFFHQAVRTDRSRVVAAVARDRSRCG